ncbi:hypothetical protein SAMN04489729_6038 [Amycolatopsis lurida]|uniref:AAA family ATPase n=1 Tax=Amycolatopsis lurida TaxID=31959 RepID=UPI00089AFAD5|nr:ATP-binding protein [Amycolatopsis lurida]SEE01026.1 hypothetical protein SAMN04489729_6038 [Amycolatopsis lurida]
MLLRFRVANHRSIRDEQELSLVAVPRQGAEGSADKVVPPAVRVAAIYGPNASGKSSVISAMYYMIVALRDSYRSWDPSNEIPRQPFLLNIHSRKQPSLFEVDFLIDDVRYNYGFELDSHKILSEWLFSYPYGKKRALFERSEGNHFRFGRSLRGENSTTARLTRPNALFLSVAATTAHEVLTPVFDYLTRSIVYADSTHNQETSRLHWLRDKLADPEFARDVGDMLRLADLGLVGIELVPDANFADLPHPEDGESDEPFSTIELDFGDFAQTPKGAVEALKKFVSVSGGRIRTSRMKIELLHSAEDPESRFSVPLSQESAGTRSWLSLAGRILFALRYGEALIVDEIDASLHPRLSATLIHIFKDEEFNRYGAQLIFTTHDVTFLGGLVDDNLLSRDEVWFTEKDHYGATSLYSLVEFKPRKAENIERGYMQGRYGALPIIDVHQIKKVLSRIAWPDRDDYMKAGHRGGARVES